VASMGFLDVRLLGGSCRCSEVAVEVTERADVVLMVVLVSGGDCPFYCLRCT
jgi:hypothetical protein